MKKFLSLSTALVLALGLLAGCGNNDTPAETTADTNEAASEASEAGADTGDAVHAGDGATITHWYWADNTEYSATMQEMVADFNETNGKGITVVAEEYPWDGGGYSENLFTAAMGGGGPDTASWKLTATPLFTANNLLAELDGLLDGWEDKGLIDDNLWDVMKQAGGSDTTYVMPWNIQVLYVYYRPSYFEAAGIEVPTTYEEFLAAIEACTMEVDGQQVYGYGMRGSTGGQEPWGSFVHGRGGDFENLDSAASIAGMQDFIDIFENGYVPPTATADGFDEIIANFKSGLTAMTIHHTGSSAGMVETFGDDVSAFAFPAGDGQWTSMGDTENVIFESCEDKEAAFEWLAYLATGKGQETWCTVTGNVPVSSEVQAMDQFTSDRFMSASIDGISYAGILPILDTTTEWISTTWPNTVAQALVGDITAEDAMKTLQEDLYR